MLAPVRTAATIEPRRREPRRRRIGRIKQGVVAMLLVATTPACYNYVPLTQTQPAPASFLAVRLTDPGSDLLTTYLGPQVRVLRGRFMGGDEHAFVLSVASVESRRGDTYSWRGETVTVPNEFVSTMQERHPARAKTALFAAAVITAFFGAYAAFSPGASGTTPTGGGQGPSPH
jgi:hypothetical protein